MGQTVFSREGNTSSTLFADQVIRVGTIYSMNEERKVYRAVAIRDEWIVAASEDPHGLDGLIDASTCVIDEPKLTILPAFDDTHNHC